MQDKNKPYKLRFSTVQARQQGGSRSIVLGRGRNVLQDYMTFSFAGTRHHTHVESLML